MRYRVQHGPSLDFDVSPFSASTRQAGSGGKSSWLGQHRVGAGGQAQSGDLSGSCPRNLAWWFRGRAFRPRPLLEITDGKKKWPLWSRRSRARIFGLIGRHAVLAVLLFDSLHREPMGDRPGTLNILSQTELLILVGSIQAYRGTFSNALFGQPLPSCGESIGSEGLSRLPCRAGGWPAAVILDMAVL